MHILKPVNYIQTITVVPREYALSEVTLYLINEQTNTTDTIVPTITEVNGYMLLSAIYIVEEGVFYNVKIEYDNLDIYRGKVYCTSQTNLKQYTLNENDYVEETSGDNTFIVI